MVVVAGCNQDRTSVHNIDIQAVADKSLYNYWVNWEIDKGLAILMRDNGGKGLESVVVVNPEDGTSAVVGLIENGESCIVIIPGRKMYEKSMGAVFYKGEVYQLDVNKELRVFTDKSGGRHKVIIGSADQYVKIQ